VEAAVRAAADAGVPVSRFLVAVSSVCVWEGGADSRSRQQSGWGSGDDAVGVMTQLCTQLDSAVAQQ
jgi:hypothetical protein